MGLLVYACETPMLINPEEVEKGLYVTFVPGNMNINSGDIAGTPITGAFDNPSSNVASHDVYVKRVYDRGESETEYMLLESFDVFPYDFSVTGDELAALFDVSIDETFGSFYHFNCRATGKNGQVADYDNLHNDLIGSAEQLQGFRFQGAVVCPSDPETIVGTYTSVTSSVFPDFADPVEGLTKTITISESGEEGFYTISDFTFGTYDHFYAAVGWCPVGDWEGTVQDVCGTFFITNPFDFWGEAGYGDFTLNDDGTFTVVGGTIYGESWTAVLTKQ